jgi:spore coat protein CotH
MNERLGYYMYRNFGVIAPRSNHAVIYINGRFNGVFANTEQIDGPFTNKNFDHSGGNLYKEI